MGAWALLDEGFYARDRIRDTPVYRAYGEQMARGAAPYRDFRPEYPPAALPAFVLPSLVAGDGAGLEEYERAFETLMLASGAATVVLVALTLAALGASPPRLAAALAFAAAWPLALGSVVLSRFDLWPAALTAAALAALVHGRERLAAGVLAAAVAAKLYAAVLVPLAAVWVWRRRGARGTLVAGGVLAGVLAALVVPFLVIAPEGVAASLGRQLGRPLQIETLGSAVLVSLHHLAGLDVEMRGSHGSQNLAGTTGGVAGAIHTGVQVAVLVALWLAFARRPVDRERLVRFAAAAVLAFVALGKVLSPQFLVWLAPLVPLVAGRRGLAASALLALALVLTQTWFPYRYWDYARDFDGAVTALVLARDLVLVAALAVLAWPAREHRERGGP